jgi:hypothetical protein
VVHLFRDWSDRLLEVNPTRTGATPSLVAAAGCAKGYGDIQPHTGFARLITATEILLGVLLLLFGFSAIISHRSDWRPPDDQG